MVSSGTGRGQRERHPARFPVKLPEFFIRFLTDPGDTVLDIFAGSNTTGQSAEAEERQWLAFEERLDYTAASIFRFMPKDCTEEQLRATYERVLSGESVDLSEQGEQPDLGLFRAAG